MRIRFAILIMAAFLAPAASAETVSVRYARDFDISGYDCEPAKPSSFVNRICYDATDAHVIVLLRDTYYEYCNMPADVVLEWRDAVSLGRFYNQHVKGGIYRCS